MQQNNIQDMTISEQVEAIKADICRNYCKYLEKLELDLEANEAQETLEEEYCANCPLTRL